MLQIVFPITCWFCNENIPLNMPFWNRPPHPEIFSIYLLIRAEVFARIQVLEKNLIIVLWRLGIQPKGDIYEAEQQWEQSNCIEILGNRICSSFEVCTVLKWIFHDLEFIVKRNGKIVYKALMP